MPRLDDDPVAPAVRIGSRRPGRDGRLVPRPLPLPGPGPDGCGDGPGRIGRRRPGCLTAGWRADDGDAGGGGGRARAARPGLRVLLPGAEVLGPPGAARALVDAHAD